MISTRIFLWAACVALSAAGVAGGRGGRRALLTVL
jgi:hypothetical protein